MWVERGRNCTPVLGRVAENGANIHCVLCECPNVNDDIRTVSIMTGMGFGRYDRSIGPTLPVAAIRHRIGAVSGLGALVCQPTLHIGAHRDTPQCYQQRHISRAQPGNRRPRAYAAQAPARAKNGGANEGVAVHH